MTSYLIDKLEALKEDENRIKEEQRVLHEEIELEIEKKRRLELDGTIIKLRTQVDELTKNIEGQIMSDNYPLLREQKTKDYLKVCHTFTNESRQGLITDEEAIKQKKQLVERKQKEDYEYREWMKKDTKITLEKFKDNLSKVDKELKDRCLKNNGGLGKQYLEIPKEIKIYDDIIHIFSTMIGVMKKQEFEIDNLKEKMTNLIVLKDI